MSSDTSGNVKVICRFRPLNEREEQTSSSLYLDFSEDSRSVTIQSQQEMNTVGSLQFNLDYIFPPSSSQSWVYKVSGEPIVRAVMQGFNGTVFVYGQTSSGKTYTMTGPNIEDEEFMGIIPRMVNTVFSQIEQSDEHIEYSVKVSYSEIYLEKVRDLLDPSKTNLKIHENRSRGVFIAELTENYVFTENEVYELMRLGSKNREVASTHMNTGSSRSHAIFSVEVTQANTLDYSAKTGKLYLVDLAGSEKVRKTGAEGKRFEEATHINKSLTTLGHVIYNLTDGKSTHVPYRDSKLTRVLQDSLGGNSKTVLIVTCSPSSSSESETISTLRFGVRAKAIKNTPKINKEYTVAELKLMLGNALEELAKRDRLITTLQAGQEPDSPVRVQESAMMSEVIVELEEVRTRLSEEVTQHSTLKQNHQKLQREYESISEEFTNLQMICELQKQGLNKKEKKENEYVEKIESLSLSKESLERELEELSTSKLKLEQQLNARIVEIEQFNLEIEVSQPQSPVKLRKSLTIKDSFEKELDLAQAKIKNLNEDLAKVKRKCKLLKESLSPDELARVKKTEILERNLSQLELVYHHIATQKCSLRVDKQIQAKKIARLDNEVKETHEQNKKLEEMLSNEKNNVQILMDQIEMLTQKNTLFVSQISKNMKKTIKGGGGKVFRGTKITPTSSHPNLEFII